MSSQIPPLVCHTPPPIDFDVDDDDDDYGSDIPEDDGICIDDRNGTDCPDEDFGDFATVQPGSAGPVEPIPAEAVIDNETENFTSIPVPLATKGIFPGRLGSDSPPSLILPPNDYAEGVDDEIGDEIAEDEDDDDFQPFGSPSQPPDPPPEDSISLPSLHFDADASKSEDDDHVPAPANATSSISGSGIETEVDLPAAAAAERTTPVIQECGRFDDNTENDFTDFTTASNERSSVVLEIPTANDVSFELDDFAQLESTPSVDSNFVSQQSRTDFATFDADFSKFDSFQASFPATVDDAVPVKTPVEEAKSMPIVEQTPGKQANEQQLPEDDFDDFQEFATFSEQPSAPASSQQVEPSVVANKMQISQLSSPTMEGGKKDMDDTVAGASEDATDEQEDDDFGEFSDFKQPPMSGTKTAPISTFSMENVRHLLEVMFPATDSPATDTGQQLTVNNIPSNSLHSQLQDFDNTSALAFQHSKSTSGKTLVTALGIDSRNIMYGPKWNSSMPRFAANLSFNPLEPIKPATSASKDAGPSVNESNANFSITSKPPTTLSLGIDALQANVASTSSSVPAAQFDWNSSGLVNPLEASHAQTLLLDLEQLEVMASLNDKINVDSSSYSPALRSTRYVANTVQLHSPTTTATSITTTTPLLLPPSPTLPLPPPPPPPLLSPPTNLSCSPLPLPTTTKTQTQTQTYNRPYHNDIQQQPQTIPNTCNTPADGCAAPSMGCATTLLVFAGANDDDRDLLISTTTMMPTPSSVHTTTTNNTTTMPPPLIESVLDEFFPMGAVTCPSGGVGWQPVGFDAVAKSSVLCDRPQTFDDYLDLSVQEMLQKATVGQPEDGPKGEVLDTQVSENAGPLVADDIAVALSSFVPPVAVPAHVKDDEDVGSLDLTAGSSSNVQYSVSVQPANREQQPLGPLQPNPYVGTHQPPQPMSISCSPSNVPVVRTIKLPETHIFTPSRGVTPVSRDITDRDIVVREYHDVEYCLEKPAASRRESDLDEFNDFQSVPAPSVSPAEPTAAPMGSVRPVVGLSPTKELEQSHKEPIGPATAVEGIDGSEEDDEFSDFQAAVPPTLAAQPVNKPVSYVQSNRSTTSSPVMLLSPAILLPQQANAPTEKDSPSRKNQAAEINWPDPGIDPDEMARFEAAFAKPTPVAVAMPTPTSAPAPAPAPAPASSTESFKVVSNQSLPKPAKTSAVEEDEWTDFISSKPEVRKEAAAPAPPPAAVSAASSGAQEEWTDFISSSSGTVGGFASHGRLSSSQNNFNYPRAPPKTSSAWSTQQQLPPPQFNSWNSNSLYYNPMSSLPLTAHPQQQQYVPQHQQHHSHLYGRSDVPAMGFAGGGGAFGGSPKVPTHALPGSGATSMMMGQQSPIQLLPELSFITPNATGPSAAGSHPGAKPATHSFLSNVISSSSFTKK